MFNARRWAEAFINSLAAGGDGESKSLLFAAPSVPLSETAIPPLAGEGLDALRTLAAWVKSLNGAVFGSSAAERLEKLIREGMARSGDSSPALEAALRFVVLMVRKNTIRHIDSVIDETKKILDKRNGLIQGSLEYAFPPAADDVSRIKELIRQQTGAARVDISEQMNAELIGGYRLRIGDEIIDASVRSQLRKFEAYLAAGVFDPAGPKQITEGSPLADGGN